MATTVGTEESFEQLVQNLLVLEHDAIAAYKSTIEMLEDEASKQQLAQFLADHEDHVEELTDIAYSLDIAAPEEGDFKERLTTNKTSLAALFGDRAIFKAMATNETETKAAYDHAAKNPVASEDAREFFLDAFDDETRHKDWMDTAATS